jgi:hypothetical protein
MKIFMKRFMTMQFHETFNHFMEWFSPGIAWFHAENNSYIIIMWFAISEKNISKAQYCKICFYIAYFFLAKHDEKLSAKLFFYFILFFF